MTTDTAPGDGPMTGTMFVADMGLSYRLLGDTCAGEIAPVAAFRLGDGRIRASVLATVSDVVAGALSNRVVAPRLPLTVDLTVHTVAAPNVSVLDVVAKLVKVGRTTVVAESWFSGRGGEQPLTLSQLTFSPSPKPEHTLDFQGDKLPSPPAFEEPWFDQLGIRIVRRGVAELDRGPYVMQPSGTIQGGAVAALIEAAAESAARAAITDLDIRYLKAIRVGPGVATATMLRPGLVRVEVRDPGNDDRLATVAIARAAG